MQRKKYQQEIENKLKYSPIVAILGPRQCGKTTLAKEITKKFNDTLFFDLENPTDLAKLADPKLILEGHNGLIVIDEIQRRPDLFLVLRFLIDQKIKGLKFLILGSASKELIRQSSETLAGRISYFELTPFNMWELAKNFNFSKYWFYGGFPRAFYQNHRRHQLIG